MPRLDQNAPKMLLLDRRNEALGEERFDCFGERPLVADLFDHDLFRKSTYPHRCQCERPSGVCRVYFIEEGVEFVYDNHVERQQGSAPQWLLARDRGGIIITINARMTAVIRIFRKPMRMEKPNLIAPGAFKQRVGVPTIYRMPKLLVQDFLPGLMFFPLNQMVRVTKALVARR